MSDGRPDRVVLVDDDGAVLAGLRHALRARRDRWTVETAEGAEAGLAALAREPADVVVSDLRMPRVDGVAFLSEVRARWPGTVRVLLSGWADVTTVTRASAVAHRYLLKPCDAETLRAELAEVSEARRHLPDPALRDAFGSLGSLPGSAATLATLRAPPEEPEARSRAVAAAVETDVGLAVRVLQVTRSPSFSTARRPEGLRAALGLVGPSLLQEIAATLQPLAADGELPGASGSLDRLGGHARAAARAMRGLLPPGADEDLLTTAALLHDAGRLAILTRMPARYLEILQRAAQRGGSVHEAEREVLGTTHAHVGAFLLGLWGLPRQIVDAVARHHDEDALSSGADGIVARVATANLLAHQADAAERLAGHPFARFPR